MQPQYIGPHPKYTGPYPNDGTEGASVFNEWIRSGYNQNKAYHARVKRVANDFWRMNGRPLFQITQSEYYDVISDTDRRAVQTFLAYAQWRQPPETQRITDTNLAQHLTSFNNRPALRGAGGSTRYPLEIRGDMAPLPLTAGHASVAVGPSTASSSLQQLQPATDVTSTWKLHSLGYLLHLNKGAKIHPGDIDRHFQKADGHRGLPVFHHEAVIRLMNGTYRLFLNAHDLNGRSISNNDLNAIMNEHQLSSGMGLSRVPRTLDSRPGGSGSDNFMTSAPSHVGNVPSRPTRSFAPPSAMPQEPRARQAASDSTEQGVRGAGGYGAYAAPSQGPYPQPPASSEQGWIWIPTQGLGGYFRHHTQGRVNPGDVYQYATGSTPNTSNLHDVRFTENRFSFINRDGTSLDNSCQPCAEHRAFFFSPEALNAVASLRQGKSHAQQSAGAGSSPPRGAAAGNVPSRPTRSFAPSSAMPQDPRARPAGFDETEQGGRGTEHVITAAFTALNTHNQSVSLHPHDDVHYVTPAEMQILGSTPDPTNGSNVTLFDTIHARWLVLPINHDNHDGTRHWSTALYNRQTGRVQHADSLMFSIAGSDLRTWHGMEVQQVLNNMHARDQAAGIRYHDYGRPNQPTFHLMNVLQQGNNTDSVLHVLRTVAGIQETRNRNNLGSNFSIQPWRPFPRISVHTGDYSDLLTPNVSAQTQASSSTRWAAPSAPASSLDTRFETTSERTGSSRKHRMDEYTYLPSKRSQTDSGVGSVGVSGLRINPENRTNDLETKTLEVMRGNLNLRRSSDEMERLEGVAGIRSVLADPERSNHLVQLIETERLDQNALISIGSCVDRVTWIAVTKNPKLRKRLEGYVPIDITQPRQGVPPSSDHRYPQATRPALQPGGWREPSQQPYLPTGNLLGQPSTGPYSPLPSQAQHFSAAPPPWPLPGPPPEPLSGHYPPSSYPASQPAAGRGAQLQQHLSTEHHIWQPPLGSRGGYRGNASRGRGGSGGGHDGFGYGH